MCRLVLIIVEVNAVSNRSTAISDRKCVSWNIEMLSMGNFTQKHMTYTEYRSLKETSPLWLTKAKDLTIKTIEKDSMVNSISNLIWKKFLKTFKATESPKITWIEAKESRSRSRMSRWKRQRTKAQVSRSAQQKKVCLTYFQRSNQKIWCQSALAEIRWFKLITESTTIQ